MKRTPFFYILFGFLCLALSACAEVGPRDARGAAAVVTGPVLSSNGAIKVSDPSGGTFFIKCRDTTGKGVDLQNNLNQLLVESGKTPARSIQDAYYVIDVVFQNYEGGKEDPNMGKGDTGDPTVDAIIAAGTPNYCYLEADVVIDELKPAPEEEPVRRKKKGHKAPPPAAPSSVQIKTVLSNKAVYMIRKAREDDALGVISSNFAKYIAGILK